MDPQIAYAKSIFLSIANDPSAMTRLERGALRRDEMHRKIQAGIRPTCYRSEWLRENAIQLVRMLAVMAENFDETHPDDQASAQDLMDVLSTAAAYFKKHLQENK